MEAVQDGVSGLLVDPSDVAVVGDAVVSVLQDSALAASLGTAGRRRAQRPSDWAIVAQDYAGPLEILVVDGMSADRSRWAASRFAETYPQPSSPVSSSRGRWVAFSAHWRCFSG
ncbi:MAG: hypothetical protein ACE5LU_22900 [Anaerolineae bacterium]